MVDVVTVPTTISGTGSDNKDGSSHIDQQQHPISKKRLLCTINNHFNHNENHHIHQYHHHQQQQKDDNDDYQYHPNKKIPIPSSFIKEEQPPPTTTTTNLLVSSSLNNIGSNISTVEERVRARYIKQQQQQEEENRSTYSTVTSATMSSSTNSSTSTTLMKQQKRNSTIDPHLLLRVTDALWSFIITNNCSQRQKQQQQKQIKNPTKEELFNRNGSTTQNFILHDLIKILRHSIQTNVYSNNNTKSTNGTTTGAPGFLQVNTDSTTSSSSQSFGNQNNNINTISKRMIVESLIELYMNPSLYSNWITLLDPTTMKSIVPIQVEQQNESSNHTSTTNQNVNKDLLLQYIQPNTIVQINSTISYQTIRKNIKLIL